MPDYQPEFGQAAFGQPFKKHAVPKIWEAALIMLREELDSAMWNIHQTGYDSPFGNTGGRMEEIPAFVVEAYSWNEEYQQPFNFKWRDVEISWYKYLGRGMSANQELSAERAADMLTECLKAVEAFEASKMRKRFPWNNPTDH